MNRVKSFSIFGASLWSLLALSSNLEASPKSTVDRIMAERRHGNGRHDPNFNRRKDGDSFVIPGVALGHWGVGNGGDWLRLGFAQAREHAALIVSRLRVNSLRDLSDSSTRDWILTHQQALASDILASEHVWELEAQPTCAWTLRPEPGGPIPTNFPIQFSYPTCRDTTYNFEQATQLLIHESVHHFDGDEDLADRVAIAIVKAWREGKIDWLPMTKDNAPAGRRHHSAVWTGQEMIIYGGENREQAFADAAAYDPNANRWRHLPEFEETAARYMHQAHWAGDRMFVWGGYEQLDSQSSVWMYEGFLWKDENITRIKAPAEWKPQPYTINLDPRQQSVWTGEQLIVWGGLNEDGSPMGGIYDPETATWSLEIAAEPGAPGRIGGHSLVWTGSKLIVWGGYASSGAYDYQIQNTGAIYDPEAPRGERWQPLALNKAPTPRAGQVGVWTGSQLLVFSGGGVQSSPDLAGTGGLYDPAKDQWQPLRSEMVIDRIGHTGTWNGKELLVFGGRSKRLSTYLGQVTGFDPSSLRWRGVNTAFDPEARMDHTAVWTGSSLIIWGGYRNYRGRSTPSRNVFFADGALFYP